MEQEKLRLGVGVFSIFSIKKRVWRGELKAVALGDFELRSREQTVDIRDDGVCLTVKYTLYGVISEEVEFFISK